MSRETEAHITPRLAGVARQLERMRTELSSGEDLSQGVDGPPADHLLLAGLFVGSVGAEEYDGVTDIATSLELMGSAVYTHYYQAARPCDERLLRGDRVYARAMSIMAGLDRPDLVAILAEATASVARGHALGLEGALENVLALRSALCAAAVRLADALARRPIDEGRLRCATVVGVAREAVLARLPGSAGPLEERAADLAASATEGRLFGEEHRYIASALAETALMAKEQERGGF